MEAKVVDDKGNELQAGEVGELLIEGPEAHEGVRVQPRDDSQDSSPTAGSTRAIWRT